MKKVINTFGQVDMSKIGNPVIVIYNTPDDYKGYFVARIWDLDQPTDTLMIKKTLREIREDIKANLPNMVRLQKAKNDVPCIVETWI